MNAQRAEKEHQRMTQTNVKRLILQFGAPTMLGLFVIALYTLADALFVSHLGTVAGAAVGVTFAIPALLQAVGYTLGMGAGSLLSRALGEKNTETAGKYVRASLLSSFLIGCIILAVGLAFGKEIMQLLGAGERVFPYALAYSRFLFWSAPFMCASFVASQLLRAEGKAVWSAVGLTVGSACNILLDAVFIDGLKMGIEGASLATLISQILSLSVLLSAYLFRKSQIPLFESLSVRDYLCLGKIFLNGLPSLFRQGLIAVSTVLISHATAAWSDAAVAAVSIVNRLFLLAFSICLGIGQGMMPVVGFNYGFKKYERVRKAYRFSLLLSSALMLAVSIPLLIFAPQILSWFRNDAEVIAIGARALRLQGAVLVLHGLVTCTIMLLQALGHPFWGTLLATARQGLFFLPLIYWITQQHGVSAVIWVQPIADLLTFLFAIPFVAFSLRYLAKKEKIRSQN